MSRIFNSTTQKDVTFVCFTSKNTCKNRKTTERYTEERKKKKNVTTEIQTSVILKEIVRLEVWYIKQQWRVKSVKMKNIYWNRRKIGFIILKLLWRQPSTTLSKFVWEGAKEKNVEVEVGWEIVKKTTIYGKGSKFLVMSGGEISDTYI